MNNRILAMLLAIIMIFSIVPVTADASGYIYIDHTHTDYNMDGICDIVICGKHMHQMSNGWSYNETGHYHGCKDSSCTEIMSEVLPHEFSYNRKDAAKHTAVCRVCAVVLDKDHVDADKNCACDLCGEIFTHDLKAVSAVPASCTEDGNIAHKACKNCGKLFATDGKTPLDADDIVVKNGGHAESSAWAKDENGHWHICNNYGCQEKLSYAEHTPGVCKEYPSDKSKHFAQCTVCSQSVNIEEHNFEYTAKEYGVETHAAKCADCGKTTVQSCADNDGDCLCDSCGALMAAGHAAGLTYVKKVLPNCELNGTESHYKCDDCGTLFADSLGKNIVTLEDLAIKALGHDYSTSWVKDETGHWHYCKRSLCDSKGSYAEHTAGVCKEYPSDKSKHFAQCTVCVESMNVEPHEYEYTAKEYGAAAHVAKCADCGKTTAQSCADGNGDCLCDKCGALMVHDHGALTYVKKVEPTCTENGTSAHYKCAACGTLFSSTAGVYNPIAAEKLVITKLGHQFSDGWIKDETGHWRYCKRTGCKEKVDFAEHTPGVCKEYPSDKSKHFAQCTVCTQSMNIEAHEYEYIAKEYGNDTHKAVCADCGKATAQSCADGDGDCLCDLCQGVMGHKRSALTYHAYKAATCTEPGNHGYLTCDTCARTFANKKDSNEFYIPVVGYEIDALGHDWLELGTTIGGRHQKQCSRCGIFTAFEHEDTTGDCLCDINSCGKLVHSHGLVIVPQVDPSCTEAGTAAYVKYEGCGKMFDLDMNPIEAPASIAPTGHDWNGQWAAVDTEKHELVCANNGCTAVQEGLHADVNNDNYCDQCNAQLQLTYVPEKPATCLEHGIKEHWFCEVNGRTYADEAGSQYVSDVNSLRIPKLKHLMVLSEVAPTSMTKTHTLVCAYGCGHTLNVACASEDGDCICDVCHKPMGHLLKQFKYVAPTCERDGVRACLYCEQCDLYYKLGTYEVIATKVIPATGHKWQSKWFVSDDEYHGKRCLNPGCTDVLYAEHQQKLEDPLKGNYHQWTCGCGYLETEIHSDTDGDNVCDECDHDMTGKSATVNKHNSATVIIDDSHTKNNGNTWWQDFWQKISPSNIGSGNSVFSFFDSLFN